MISSLKLKISVAIIVVTIVSATSYWYISSERSDHENIVTNEKTNITALEALNFTFEYMDSKYEKYNLSNIWLPYKNWRITYVINNGDKVIYEEIFVYDNGTISTGTRTYNITEILTWYYPQDLHGFDIELLKIDSDEALTIIKEKVPSIEDYEYYLRLECSIFTSAKPMWAGEYYMQGFRQVVKVNATTGEHIEYQVELSSGYINNLGNITENFNGSKFTALDGLFLSNHYMESKHERFNLSELYPIFDDSGYSDSWTYIYIIRDNTNRIIHKSITVYDNGTLKLENRVYEMWDLSRGTYCGIRDAHGFDAELLKIDSNDAIQIVIQNETLTETWENKEYFSLRLEQENYPTYRNTNPVWCVHFSSYFYWINATSGIISNYHINT